MFCKKFYLKKIRICKLKYIDLDSNFNYLVAMLSKGDVEKFIIKELSIICKESESSYSSKTQLVGEKRSIKSMQLVELLLKMEDYVEKNFNSEFNWDNNSAMSETFSVLRTVESLAEHVIKLNSKK